MMTLKELKKRVPVADKNGSVLGKTELLNSGAKIVVKEMVDTGVEISVFDNGYVLFEEDKHKTIFCLHSCKGYDYGLLDEKENIFGEEFFENENWYILPLMIGMDRVEASRKRILSNHNVISIDAENHDFFSHNNGKTDADLLKGVGFSAYLKSSLKVNADGSYDFTSARPVVITADGKTEMFTDEKGYACSIPLPYGTYIVKETTSLHNFDPVDDFEVVVSEHKPNTPQVWRVLLDNEFKAKLKIVKKDDETKKTVLLPKTEFKVFDLTKNAYVEQVTTYPVTKVHKSYFTDKDGYLILPNSLRPGNYRIEEVTAPEGYTLNTNFVTVAVDTNTAFLMDSVSGDAIITVEYENHPVKGQLTIYKQGEMLTSYDGEFHYEMKGLEGAEFEVYAAEDIYTADHQVDENGNRLLYFAKDALVANVATNEEGKAVVKNLPLGKYYVKETKATDGFVLNTTIQDSEFVYADQNTPVIFDEMTYTNERQKVSITVEKQDAETGDVVEGAVFGIYNAEDIKDRSGNILVTADSLLQEMTTGEDGQAVCTLDLPLLLQESIEKYLLQVRKFYPMSIRRALHCFHICLEIYNQSQVRSDVENGQRILPLRLFLPPGVHVFQYRLSLPILEIVL